MKWDSLTLTINYWIISILISFSLLILFAIFQDVFYLKPAEQVSDVIFLSLSNLQFLINGIRFVRSSKIMYRKSEVLFILSLLSLVFTVIVSLFMARAAFWCWETGNGLGI